MDEIRYEFCGRCGSERMGSGDGACWRCSVCGHLNCGEGGSEEAAPFSHAVQEYEVTRRIKRIIKKRWPDGRRYWWLFLDGLSWPGYYDRELSHTLRVGDLVRLRVVVTKVGERVYWGVKGYEVLSRAR